MSDAHAYRRGWRVQANQDCQRIDVIPPQGVVITGPITLRWNLDTRQATLVDADGVSWSLPIEPLDDDE